MALIAVSSAYVLLDPHTGRVKTDLSQEQNENEEAHFDAIDRSEFVAAEPDGQQQHPKQQAKDSRPPIASEYYDSNGNPIYKIYHKSPYGR